MFIEVWEMEYFLPYWKTKDVTVWEMEYFLPYWKTKDVTVWEMEYFLPYWRTKDATVISTAALQHEAVSPERAQEGKNTHHIADIGLQPLPKVSPEETQDARLPHTASR